PVGTSLKDDDEVPYFGPRQQDLLAEDIERRAQTAHDSDFLELAVVDCTRDGQGVVPSDHLAEVARRGELMVHTAVDHDEGGASGDLAVHHTGDVHPGLAHEVAPELDADPNVAQHGAQSLTAEPVQVVADRCEV